MKKLLKLARQITAQSKKIFYQITTSTKKEQTKSPKKHYIKRNSHGFPTIYEE